MKSKQNYSKKVYFILYLCLFVIYLPAESTQSSTSKSEYGQKIFKKKLRRLCKRTAANFAQIHTPLEWKTLKDSNSFRTEIYKICPKSIHHIREEWVDPLYAFSIVYAKDTKRYIQNLNLKCNP